MAPSRTRCGWARLSNPLYVAYHDAGFDPLGLLLALVTGVGFDLLAARGLFEPFGRQHPASRFDGAGMGLAIVRRVAERHGGRVWAESAPDRGATFRFTLPAA